MGKILIVEDDRDLVESYTDLLEAHHHQVTSVGKASEVVPILSRLWPDLIILDLNLPGASGVVVISLVRNYQRMAKTKIIIVTGYPELLESRNYISSRVDFIMRKPFQNETLIAKIDELLSLSVS
jgi:DNA-binding response OmpR family regulator